MHRTTHRTSHRTLHRTTHRTSHRTLHRTSPLRPCALQMRASLPNPPRQGNSRSRTPRPQNSRSRSPVRSGPDRPASTRPRSRSRQRKQPNEVFQPGAAAPALSACTLCLGRHRHDIARCNAVQFWDHSAARCRRNEGGRLVNPSGTTLCSDWQLPRGCANSSHPDRHECSGCGNKAHGAQSCPRSQKA